MNRRTALYIMGGIIGIGVSRLLISKYIDYKDVSPNKKKIKQVKCEKRNPIVEYIRINQPKLHLEFISKAKSRKASALNYNIVLEELNNLEFVTVDGFFLPYSEIEESYNSSVMIQKACL